MSSINYLPGITKFKIYNSYNDESPLIKYNSMDQTEIFVEFTLTGLNKLINPYTNKPEEFYIYVFLFKQDGGIDTEVVSSSYFFCDESEFSSPFATFKSNVEITPNGSIGNFMDTFYFLEVIYSKYEANDGMDLNYLVNNYDNKLIRSKIAFQGEDDE